MTLPGHGCIFTPTSALFFKDEGIYRNVLNMLAPYPGLEKDRARGKACVSAENVTIWLTLFYKMIWLKNNSVRL